MSFCSSVALTIQSYLKLDRTDLAWKEVEKLKKQLDSAISQLSARFEEKVAHQFEGASEQTKIVFANVEYLWAMPMENIPTMMSG